MANLLHIKITSKGLSQQAADFFRPSKKDTKMIKGKRKHLAKNHPYSLRLMYSK